MINSKRIYFVNLMMKLLPNSGCQSLKACLFRWAGVRVGKGVEIFQGVCVQGIGELEWQDRCFIGHEVLFLLNAGSHVVVEEDSMLGSRSTVVTGFHPYSPEGARIVSRVGTSSQIRIGRGCGIATGCIILPGVEVGEMSLVAAGATVAADVKPYTLVGGTPARWIKDLK